mmetsp:Transcript_41164/g.80575  ORF Transcript_41164/g.80575 Transcript_41164/m.80575 type:complete len:207 (+) Transcript_41164:68-688(+)
MYLTFQCIYLNRLSDQKSDHNTTSTPQLPRTSLTHVVDHHYYISDPSIKLHLVSPPLKKTSNEDRNYHSYELILKPSTEQDAPATKEKDQGIPYFSAIDFVWRERHNSDKFLHIFQFRPDPQRWSQRRPGAVSRNKNRSLPTLREPKHLAPSCRIFGGEPRTRPHRRTPGPPRRSPGSHNRPAAGPAWLCRPGPGPEGNSRREDQP